MTKELNKSLTKLVVSKVSDISKFKKEFINGLHILLNGNYVKYDIDNSIYNDKSINISDDSFQKILSNINEKSEKRKSNGVYYTPNDVAKYIICNSIVNRLLFDNKNTHNYEDCIKILSNLSNDKTNQLLYRLKTIDPTCGSGEFLLNTFELKYNIIEKANKINDNNILKISDTIYGNDIDEESTDISKIRLYFYISSKLKNKTSFEKLAKILKTNFYNYDFISESNKINNMFDLIVGNPPYVEYAKYPLKEKLVNDYGNIYADVIRNSIDLLSDKGVLGYIIPLSYTATARMSKIRDYVKENTRKQFILNFADRPDCLFDGVHQKLNILISQKGNTKNRIYTSNYKHWYNEERKQLLNGREVRLSKYSFEQFIPKIGNDIEESIFDKIYTKNKNNIFEIQKISGKELYLNMRACFWIKAFTFNPGSNEYKSFKYSNDIYNFILCLLNSSLFWLYWTIISDCWHITTKELKSFKIPVKNIDIVKFDKLSKKLETKLENTKKYVGTKQVDYEYKHKLCKDVIDEIDDELAEIYDLTQIELDYIKSFAIKYRSGGEIDD